MKRTIILLAFMVSIAATLFSQEAQNTRNSADQLLKSTGTINT
jgi:hypothetical protein